MLCKNLQLFCSVCVELKQVNGSVSDIVKQTVNWLQMYFATGLGGNLPTVCVLSDSRLGNKLFFCIYPLFTSAYFKKNL